MTYINSKRQRSTRFRYFIAMAIICGSSFVIVNFTRSGDLLINKHEVEFFFQNTTNKRFTLDTIGCRIPYLNIIDNSIKKFVYYPNNMKKCHNSNESLLEYKDSIVSIKRDNLKYYNISDISKISCCYEAFVRPVAIDNILSIEVDDRVDYKPCINFNDTIQLKDEFVRISCSSDVMKNIYIQFYLSAIKKKFMEHDDIPEMPKGRSAYNVIIMGIDAVSRLNLYRTMPKTIEFINRYGGVDLAGYNKLGDNTYPNVIAMLLGVRDTELKQTCLPYKKAPYDNCPFVWEWFKQAGYYTALAEDSGSLGTFNYLRAGFSKTPTDYYLHTFINQAEKIAGYLKDFNSFLCMNDKHFFQVLLDYIKDLTMTLRDNKLFGFFWEVTMSHDYLNYPMVMDDRYLDLFIGLEKSGYLNKTIVFLLSDHGIRWGDIRSTKQGQLEERLPFSFIMVPPSFRKMYPKAYSNLRLNSNRLTTPFDIHETLVDLIDLSNLSDDAINNKSNSFYAHKRAISLFLPIPDNRTCVMADIDDHWCTCHRETVLQKQSSEGIEAASSLVAYLNSLLSGHPECARLKLSDIIQVVEVEVGRPYEKVVGWREYKVMVRTKPGEAIFEATLRNDNQLWTLAGTVSRLNLYGSQSQCVDDSLLKLYCYCS